jgi:hypothetical protein
LESGSQELAAARGQLAAVQQQLAGLLRAAAAKQSAPGLEPAAGSPRWSGRSPLGPPLSPRTSRVLQAAELDGCASPRHAGSSGGGAPDADGPAAGAPLPAEMQLLLQQLGAWVASARQQLAGLEVERQSLQQDVQHLSGEWWVWWGTAAAAAADVHGHSPPPAAPPGAPAPPERSTHPRLQMPLCACPVLRSSGEAPAAALAPGASSRLAARLLGSDPAPAAHAAAHATGELQASRDNQQAVVAAVGFAVPLPGLLQDGLQAGGSGPGFDANLQMLHQVGAWVW